MERQPPELILFDMDDVLCDYSRAARIAYLANLAGREAEEIEAEIWHSGFEALGDSGTVDAAHYLAEFGERIGYPLSRVEWIAARRAAMTPRPAMLALATTLARHHRIGVLTNNNLLVTDAIDTLFPGLRGVFGEAIFASAGFKAAKPDVECFHRACAAMGTAPEATFFTDDLLENVQGARGAGLTAHHFTGGAAGVAPLREALREVGAHLD